MCDGPEQVECRAAVCNHGSPSTTKPERAVLENTYTWERVDSRLAKFELLLALVQASQKNVLCAVWRLSLLSPGGRFPIQCGWERAAAAKRSADAPRFAMFATTSPTPSILERSHHFKALCMLLALLESILFALPDLLNAAIHNRRAHDRLHEATPTLHEAHARKQFAQWAVSYPRSRGSSGQRRKRGF